MKRPIYILFSIVIVSSLNSCSGSSDYNATIAEGQAAANEMLDFKQPLTESVLLENILLKRRLRILRSLDDDDRIIHCKQVKSVQTIRILRS